MSLSFDLTDEQVALRDKAHAFAQDDIALAERLSLTLGAKVETNVYTGAEFMPNADFGGFVFRLHRIFTAIAAATAAKAVWAAGVRNGSLFA